MEISFLELRAKEVVNTQDGRKLGKVCDIVLCYPENRWLGIVAPNGRGFRKSGVFIQLRNIVKIGEDVILVNVGLPKKHGGKRANNLGGGNGGNVGAPDFNGGMSTSSNMSYGDMQGRSFEEYE